MISTLLLTAFAQLAPQEAGADWQLALAPPERFFGAIEERSLLALAQGEGDLPLVLGTLRTTWQQERLGLEPLLLPDGIEVLAIGTMQEHRLEVGRSPTGLSVRLQFQPPAATFLALAANSTADRPGDLQPLALGAPFCTTLAIESERWNGTVAALWDREKGGIEWLLYERGTAWGALPSPWRKETSPWITHLQGVQAPEPPKALDLQGFQGLGLLHPNGFSPERAQEILVQLKEAAQRTGTPWVESKLPEQPTWLTAKAQGGAIVLASEVTGNWTSYWPALEAGALLAVPTEEDRRKALRAKVKLDLAVLNMACTQYYIRHSKYPAQLEELTRKNETGRSYLKGDLPEDPWGRPYLYRAPKEASELPSIYTLGADGEEGGAGEDQDLSIEDVMANRL